MRKFKSTMLAAVAGAALWAVSDTPARELAVDPAEMLQVELATVGVNPVLGAPVVLLRDFENGDIVPIFIGVAEANAILMAMHGIETPRPMTHDLMASLLSSTGMSLNRVMVDALADNTFFGMLELAVPGSDQPVLVDTRPSDGLALAVRTGAPILVAREVLAAGRELEYEGLESDQVVSALGITVVEATEEYRESLGLPDEPGLLVWRSTGRAEREGITAGTMILEVNGQAPELPMDFLELIRDTPSGEQVRITFWSDGDVREVTLPPDLRAPEEPTIEI